MSSLHITTNKAKVIRKEGEVWMEDKKQWTIKNGLKRSLSKMDESRKEAIVPLVCPTCQSAMKHHLDTKMWNIHKTCFNCVIDMEHEIIKAGNWKSYEKNKIIANAAAMEVDLEAFLKEHVQESAAKANVTEDGLVERWRDVNSKIIEATAQDELTKFKTKIKNFKR